MRIKRIDSDREHRDVPDGVLLEHVPPLAWTGAQN